MYNIISEDSFAEIVEKKSKFIASVFYVEDVENAENKIKEIKKKYYDARHNCFAYSVLTNEGVVNRFSDDGEPSGTAGSPMLNIIVSQNLTNILVVVTRYFGGILLGTGGLVRAYTLAFQKALSAVEKNEIEKGLEVKVITSYQEFEKNKYYFRKNDIEIIDINYSENIEMIIELTNEKFNIIKKDYNEHKFLVISINKIKEKNIKRNNK